MRYLYRSLAALCIVAYAIAGIHEVLYARSECEARGHYWHQWNGSAVCMWKRP